jgi:AraC family transcriptional regulator, activator of mtrCDE
MPEWPEFMPVRSAYGLAAPVSWKRGFDVAGDFFNSLLGLRAKLTYAGGVCGRWAIDHNSNTAIWVHLVTKGSVWVHSATRPSPLQLDEGDLVVFLPHAELHYFSYSPQELVFGAEGASKTSVEDGTAAFVCAVVELGLPKAGFWRALPAEIVVRSTEAQDMLAELTRLIVAEARHYRFGSFVIVERLCDSIFVLTVRHCVERGLVHQGVFSAMNDSRLQTVLSLIHREPWHPWTVAELGARAGLSKTTLTAKFTQVMGCAPKEYLIQWRMQTAANWLKESTLAVEVIAEKCGYFSVSAFSRTFKRCVGVAPGVYRQRWPSMPSVPAMPQRNAAQKGKMLAVVQERRRVERRRLG